MLVQRRNRAAPPGAPKQLLELPTDCSAPQQPNSADMHKLLTLPLLAYCRDRGAWWGHWQMRRRGPDATCWTPAGEVVHPPANRQRRSSDDAHAAHNMWRAECRTAYLHQVAHLPSAACDTAACDTAVWMISLAWETLMQSPWTRGCMTQEGAGRR